MTLLDLPPLPRPNPLRRAATVPVAPVPRPRPDVASSLPPPPPGFELVEDDLDIPPPPPGFELVAEERRPATFGESMSRGVDVMQQGGFAALEAAGEWAGLPTLTRIGREGRERNTAEIAAGAPRARVADVRTASDLVQWGKEIIGEQIPIMAPSLAGGLAGGAAGAMVGGPIGATIGAAIGAFIPSAVLGTGETQTAIKEKDPSTVAPGWAFAGGTAIGALDSIIPGKVGSQLVKVFGRDTAEAIAKRALTKPVKQGAIVRIAKGTGQGMAVEGFTEAIQEAISEVAASQATGQPIDYSSLGEQMVEAGLAGSLLGGTVGGIAAAPAPRQAALPPPPAGFVLEEEMGLPEGAQPAEALYPEPEALKEAPTPAPAKGMVRLYHGGGGDLGDPADLNDLWVTPHLDYAKNYRRAGDDPENNVWYVDVPESEAASLGVKDEINNILINGKLPSQYARKAKPFRSAETPADITLPEMVVEPEAATVTAPEIAPENIPGNIPVLSSPDISTASEPQNAPAISGPAVPPPPEGFVQQGKREAPVKIETAEDLEVASVTAAPEPSEAQAAAGNYQKAHVKLQGLDITIENPKGSIRRGKGADGTPWEVKLPAAYGYIKRTRGADSTDEGIEQIDVYVGEAPQVTKVFVIDQNDLATGAFDEHKVMMGVPNEKVARDLYARAFSDGKGKDRIGTVTAMTIDEFKTWLKEGDTTKPVGKSANPPPPKAAELPKPQPTEKPAEIITPPKSARVLKMSDGRFVPVIERDGQIEHLRDDGEWHKGEPPTTTLKVGGTAHSGNHPAAFKDEAKALGIAREELGEVTAPEEHPGLVIKSLETGKEETIQPAGTVPPKAKKPPTRSAEKSTWKKIGVNAGGVTIDEDQRGVRSVVIDGVRRSEPVAIKPGGGISTRSRDGTEWDIDVAKTAPVAPPAATKPEAAPETSTAPAEPPAAPEWWTDLTEAGRAPLIAKASSTLSPKTAWHNLSSENQRKVTAAYEAQQKAEADAPNWAEVLHAGPLDAKGRPDTDMIFSTMEAITGGERTYAKLTPEQKGELLAAMKATKTELAVPERPTGYGAANTLVTAARADELRKRLRAKLRNQVSAGIDPEILAIGAELAAFHIEAGTRKFVDFARAIAKDLGVALDEVRPYLRSWYNGARDMLEDGGHDIAGMDGPEEVREALKTLGKEPSDGRQRGEGTRDLGEGGEPETTGDLAERQPDREGTDVAVAAGAAEDGGGDRGPRSPASVGARLGQQLPQRGESVPEGGDVAAGRPRAGDEGVAPADAGVGGRPGDGEQSAAVRPNYFIADPDSLIGGGPKVRFARNRQAIEAYRAITEEGRDPSQAELDAMAAYIGWGSFGQELFQGNWERPRPKPAWETEDKWLREHLGQKEWQSAQSSIINAHYTDPPTVSAMWAMVERMGFKGGRVLEPSMGIGNFFGLMPRGLMDKSDLTGIELDELSGGMATLLYPHANIQIKGYEKSKTPDGFYDLVIGNWPFAADGPADRRYDALSPSLHDYFFVKAIDQVRAGGLVVGITSAGTMDKVGKSVRLALAKKAELVAAYRLPSGAFEKYAGTSVVTDIIVLKKREAPLASATNENWIEAVEVDTPAGEKVRVNQYFKDNPGNILGTLNWGHGTTSGRPGMIVDRPADLLDRLTKLPSRLPEGIYEPKKRGKEPRFVANNSKDRDGSITVSDGRLYVVQGERLALLEDVVRYKVKGAKENASREAQLAELVDLRKAYGRLIDAERDGDPSTETHRNTLRLQYEAFRQAHGPIIDSAGLDIIRKARDPFASALEALETADGRPSRILTEPTTRGKKALDKPSVREAFVIARNEGVKIDIARVATLAGRPEAEVARELVDAKAIYRTPGGGYEVADVYLSGNVRRKLREAQDALDRGEDMQGSIDALRSVLPRDVPYFQIEAKLGAPWIDNSRYREFLAHLLAVPEDMVGEQNVTLRFAAGSWRVHFTHGGLNARPEAQAQWGTPDLRFDRLVRSAMNNQTITIRYKDADGSMVVDEPASKQANEKARLLREEFTSWVWRDAERRIVLERAYNEVMNAIARPAFDGAFLDFSGMAIRRGNDAFSLRKHQVDAIWRGVVNGRGLFAHEVGTGKTYTIAGIAVESRRYGISKKPLVLAHNANSAAVARGIREMYPGAQVLYVDNLSPETIDTTLRRIANEDWDAVVMPHSIIDRLALKEETLNQLAAEQIAALEDEAMAAAEEDGVALDPGMMDSEDDMRKVRSVTAKQLVHQRNAIKKKIAELATRASREGAIAVEDLGIDMVLVDEVHEFKKPPIATKMRMKGLNTATSNRSIMLQFLTGYVKQMNGGKGVHLFTGTPITNTLTEIFNMMRFVMDDEMSLNGVSDWDGWFNTFADSLSDVELTATGEYEPVTRLAAFVNVADLSRMAGQYVDTVFADDMPEFKPRETGSGKTMAAADLTDSERAELVEGRSEDPIGRPYKKIVNEVAPLNPRQAEVLQELVARARRFRALSRKDRRDAMLSGSNIVPIRVETDAANASLDVRLFDPEQPDDPTSKANRAVRNILDIYKGSPVSTQVVFMERGFSSEKVSRRKDPGDPERRIVVKTRGFNLAEDIVQKLVDGGIPVKEIAIVDGSVSKLKREEIAQKMNRSEIRVVIGNSTTLGVGVNMQENLRAMHHLDAPWMPGILEQRNGRGWRQGNKWNTVLEVRYITEGLDGRRWQVLAIKDRFIKAFLKADDTVRIIEGDAASDAEGEDMMGLAETLSEAAGDPRLLIVNKLRADISRLEGRERLHSFGVVDARRKAEDLQNRIRDSEARLPALGQDVAYWEAEKQKPFSASIDGTEYTDKEKWQGAIDKIVRTLVAGDKPQSMGVVRGFALHADWSRLFQKEPEFFITSPASGARYQVKPSLASVEGIARGFAAQRDKAEASGDDMRGSVARLQEAAQMPFQQQDTLDSKRRLFTEVQADIVNNPVPPPPWLRHGAPIDTVVYVGGEPRVVAGHRWTDRDYIVVTAEGEVSYRDVTDEAGMPLYDPREYAPPVVKKPDDAPKGPPSSGPSDSEVRGRVDTAPFEVTRDQIERASVKVQEIATRILGHKIRAVVAKELPPYMAADYIAAWDPVDRAIWLTMKAARDVETLANNVGHEAMHALKYAGVITDSEWRLLVNMANRKGFALSAETQRIYEREHVEKSGASRAQFREMMDEEAVARMFGAYVAGQETKTGADRVMARIMEFLEAVANFMRGEGFVSAFGVMRQADAGRLAAREGGGRLAAGSAAALFSDQGTTVNIGSTTLGGRKFKTVRVAPVVRGSIRAYHGSPHDFDRFDMSRIGTGEGAQAYGHGLYFAENEATAKNYRDSLTEQILVVPGRGGVRNAKIGDTVGVENAIRDFANEIGVNLSLTGEVARFTHSEDLASIMLDAIDAEAMDIGAAIARLDGLAETEPQHLQQTFVSRDKAARIGEMYRAASDGLRKMNAAGLDVQEFGRLYEARINADPDEFLDWDRRLLEQSSKVQAAARKVMSDLGISENVETAEELAEAGLLDDAFVDHTGQNIYNDISRVGRDEAARLLREAGIRGIRYLDQGSRATSAQSINRLTDDLISLQQFERSAKDPVQKAAFAKEIEEAQSRLDDAKAGRGAATYNYVVFDDSLIEIVSKDGRPPGTDIRGSVVTPDQLGPAVAGGAQARQQAMSRGFEFQPIDRAIRIPFDIFGGTNEKGEWKPGLYLSKRAGRIITTSRFADNSRFAFMNPVLHRARAGLVDRYGLDPEYVARERKRALEERGTLADVPEIMQAMAREGMGAQEARVLHNILVGEAVADADMARLSEPIRNSIDQFGAEAVELGLISAESFERNRGKYLHRVYLKHETDQSGLAQWVGRMMSTRRKKIIGEEVKGRGLFKLVDLQDLPWEGETAPANGTKFVLFDKVSDDGERIVKREFRRFGAHAPEGEGWVSRGAWEIRGRSRGKLVLWRDFTKEERTRMGEITDARYTVAKTYMLMAHDLSVGRFYRDIARNADWATASEPRETWKEAGDYSRFWADPDVEWVRVPDTKIPKSDTLRYGALAGKWVRAEIWRDINELEKLNKENLWTALLTQWKLNKTARSPVVHMNNIMSNLVLMDMSGVGVSDLVAGLRSLVTGDALYQEAQANGAMGVDMASQEIRRNVLAPILEEIERGVQGGQGTLEARLGVLGKLADGIWSAVKFVDRKMLDLYRIEDEVFRMALYARRRAQGIGAQEAADETREQFIDYDIRAPWINVARRTVLPFLSYIYRAAPLVARTVMTRPWKLAKYFAIMYGVNALSYFLLPGDEDEERRSMREEEQGLTWVGAPRMVRLPFADETGNPYFLDVRRWIPAGDIFDVAQGSAAIGIPAPLNFGGPLMMGAELVLNKQAFTGKEIVNELADDWWDKTAKVGDWAWKSWMPSAAWVPGSWYWNKIGNAITGARDWQGRPYSVPAAVASSVGIKVSPRDVQEGFRIWGIEFDKIERELKSERKRLGRDHSRGLISREEYEARFLKYTERLRALAERRRKTFTGE